MTVVSSSIGSRLRAERENRGLSLPDVSEFTKIPVSLLEGLERDDLRRWPKGLYRRAFFRSYVEALGLPPEPLTTEFGQRFPDDGEAAPPPPPVTPRPRRPRATVAWRASLAKQLAAARAGAVSVGAALGRWRNLAPALFGALVELALVVGAGALAAWITGTVLLAGIGGVAIVFYPVSRAVAGRSRSIAPALQRSGRALGRGAAIARRQGARTLAALNYGFWSVVRAAAASAQGLAIRRLNRSTGG